MVGGVLYNVTRFNEWAVSATYPLPVAGVLAGLAGIVLLVWTRTGRSRLIPAAALTFFLFGAALLIEDGVFVFPHAISGRTSMAVLFTVMVAAPALLMLGIVFLIAGLLRARADARRLQDTEPSSCEPAAGP